MSALKLSELHVYFINYSRAWFNLKRPTVASLCFKVPLGVVNTYVPSNVQNTKIWKKVVDQHQIRQVSNLIPYVFYSSSTTVNNDVHFLVCFLQ